MVEPKKIKEQESRSVGALRMQFESYREKRLLFYISELELRNALLLLFTQIGAKQLTFLNSKEEVIYEVMENAQLKVKEEERYAVSILSFHHHLYDNSSVVSGLLQSVQNGLRGKSYRLPFLVLAENEASVAVQFGKTPEVRSMSIRAAARNGLKGIVIGNVNSAHTQKTLTEKVIEVIEATHMQGMKPFERKMRNLINTAYSYLNKMFWSDEEREDNVKKALQLFEEVLEHSQDNYEAMLGKAIASSKSDSPKLLSESINQYEEVMSIGKDLERIYEGHAGSCYKMAAATQDDEVKKLWLKKGVRSLSSLNEMHEEEIRNIRKVQPDYINHDMFSSLASTYSRIGDTLMQVGEENSEEAMRCQLKGIEYDRTIKGNYKVVELMQKTARTKGDYMKIAKVCSIAREHVPEKAINYLATEAESYFKAGKYLEATRVFKSINKYVSKDRLETWIRHRQEKVIVDEDEQKQVELFITFLNHRAIHFRRIGNYESSVSDLSIAISLDPEETYYDIFFNLAKAVIDANEHNKKFKEYTTEEGIEFFVTALRIALNQGEDAYLTLLKTVRSDPILNPSKQNILVAVKKAGLPLPKKK